MVFGEEPMTPAERIVKAWTDEGRAPLYHREMQLRLMLEWPVLASAIKALVEESQ